MFDDSVLRKFAEWEPVDGWSERQAHDAAKAFVNRASGAIDVAAFFHETSYENFATVFAYLPENAERIKSAANEVQSRYSSLLLYFSHLAPVVAVGTGIWSETVKIGGRVTCRGYSELGLSNLLSPEQVGEVSLKQALISGLASTGCTFLAPATLKQPAPPWFEPLERSKGDRPWNRLFHLLFQFCD